MHMSDEQNKYSDYLVIFVDIFGSQNRTDFCELYQINKIFHEELERNQQNDLSHVVYHRKIYTFSDCAYIFYGFKDGISEERKDVGKLFTVALCNCESLFLRFLKEKIIFRGGVCYGEAYLDPCRNMFFGSAVNNAYKLESEVAVHPRIVIDRFVAEKILGNISQVRDDMKKRNQEYVSLIERGLMPNFPITGEGIVEQDIDEQYIFNYLHFPENNMILQECYLFCKDFIEELVHFCREQIDKNTQYKVIDKYYYLLRFSKTKLENLLQTYEFK